MVFFLEKGSRIPKFMDAKRRYLYPGRIEDSDGERRVEANPLVSDPVGDARRLRFGITARVATRRLTPPIELRPR